MADQEKMTGRRDRNEFSQAFDNSEEHRLDEIQCHVSSATERMCWIAPSGWSAFAAPRDWKCSLLERMLLEDVLTKSKPASSVPVPKFVRIAARSYELRNR